MQLQPTLDQQSSNSSRLDLREGVLFSLLLVVSRVVLMLVLAKLTGARDFTDDSSLHLSMSNDPFEVLTASNLQTAHFPPLLPVFESSSGYFYQQVFPPFYSLRMLFITFELIAFALTWLVLTKVCNVPTRRLLAALWIVMPMTWMSSTVMEQEEMLSAAFCACMMLLILQGRLNAAIVTCSLAVVSAKIFFLVPLLALVLGPSIKPTGALVRRIVLAAAPVVIVYAIAISIWMSKGIDIKILSFTPPTALSTTFWATIAKTTGMSNLWAKNLSMPLALIGGLLPLILAKWRYGGELSTERLMRLAAAMWLWVFALFYEISPEYYMMLVPLLMVTLNPRLAVGVLGGMLSIAWAINFFYGVEMATAPEAAERKAAFIRLYNSIFPFSPGAMHNLSVAVFVLLSFWLAIHMTREMLRPGETPLAT